MSRPLLTVGAAVYDDFAALALTVQSARLHQGLSPDELEIVVVDNHPVNSARLESFCRQARAKYVPFPSPVGTSAARDAIFTQASAETVCVLDSHVLLAPGALNQLLSFAEYHPDSVDLWHGPLLYDPLDGCKSATHMEAKWGPDLMFGVWEHNPRGADPAGDAFEIPMHGLGLFACRRAAWPGFPPGLTGFGGEEGMLHQAFRQAGGKILCLPFLRWWHLFRDQPAPFPVTHGDRFRNYLIWHKHLALDDGDLIARFRAKLPPDEFARVIESQGLADRVPLPSLPAQLSNYARAFANHLVNGFEKVNETEFNARLEICGGCAFKHADRCRLCGCDLALKAIRAVEICPARKWPGDPAAVGPCAQASTTRPDFARAAQQTGCAHANFDAEVNVFRGPPGQDEYGAAVAVRCRDCGLAFVFPGHGHQTRALISMLPSEPVAATS